MDPDFRVKIGIIRTIMNDKFPELNWEQQVVESNKSISVDKVPVRETIALPQAGNLVPGFFDDYVKELRAEDGTKRAKTTPGVVLEQNKLVNRHKFGVDRRYKVVDCPWNVKCLENNKITDSSVYVSKAKKDEAKKQDFPEMSIKVSHLKSWESGNRELLNVLTYGDWFVACAKLLVQTSVNRIAAVAKKKEPLEGDQLTFVHQFLNDSYNLLDSAGKCIQDTNKVTVEKICGQVLVRRDSWLSRFAPEVGQKAKDDLRCCDFNGKELFGEKEIEAAKKSMEDKKLDKAQSSLIESQAKLNQQMRFVTTAVNKGKQMDRPKYPPFQRQGGGPKPKPLSENQQSNYQTNYQSNYQQGGGKRNDPKPPIKSGSNRGRGGGRRN